jgi:hypothetical protein
VATTLDTQASGTVTYLGWNGVQPFVGLSTNIPTGRSALFGPQANARMDPDLVEIATFGEGFNIGPSAGVSVPVTSTLIITASAGYTWREPFTRENSTAALDPNLQAVSRVDPGDVFTATAAMNYRVDAWLVSVTGSVSHETVTTENYLALYRPGLRYVGSANVIYNWTNIGQTTFTAAASHSNRNEVLFLGAPSLVAEIFNTNSNLYRLGLQHLFPASQQVYLGPIGSYLLRTHNSYDQTTLQFVPAKERWSAGMLARYVASPRVVWNARAERVWTQEDERLAAGGQTFSVLANAFVAGSGVPIVSSTGWQFTAGANVTF